MAVHNRPGSDCRGFTMIELMVALAIGLVVFAATSTLFVVSLRTFRSQAVTIGVQQDARAALEIMSREIRMAGFNPCRHSGAGIVTAESGRIGFTLDRNMNGHVDSTDEEYVSYALDPKKRTIYRILYKDDKRATKQPLVEGASDLAFTYLNAQGDPASAPDDIKSIGIAVTCAQRDTGGRTVSRSFSTTVALRNRIIFPYN